MKLALRYMVLILWLAGSAYLGGGAWVGAKILQDTTITARASPKTAPGIVYDGITFRNEQEELAFLFEQKASNLFPWVFAVPLFLMPLVLALAFGILGGVAAVVKHLVLDAAHVNDVAVVGLPLFGGFIGMMVSMLGMLIPSALSANSAARPEAMAGLALFGGLFSKQAFEAIERIVIDKIFKSRSTKSKSAVKS